MVLRRSSKRFAGALTCVLTSLMATSSRADMPPLGYVGEVPRPQNTATMPPLGYVGPVAATPKTTKTLLAIHTLAAPATQDEPVLRSPTAPLPASPTPELKAAPPTPSVAQPKNAQREEETLITAKQMHSDTENQVVTATGEVEIVRGGYILHADKVIYDQKRDVMIADGHVALLTPDGDVQFADHQEVTGDMKQAFAENVGVLFTDNSRLAAKNLQRYDERYTVAEKGLYTACNVCRENPDIKPLWQLRAETITHDNVDHELYYHNATIDFAGTPVVYTPYMSGPDPTVKRRQGFLSPIPGESPNIGAFIKVPYYIDIAPDKDMTVTPTFSETDRLQLATQYRQRFAKGSLVFDGSGTYAKLINDQGVDKGEQWRGHVFGTFLYDIDDTWRAGSDVQYVSDKSYLARYKISSIDQTISRGYVEGFRGRNYSAVNTYYFQDLRAGTTVAEPTVFPSFTYSALGAPGQTWGGRWSFDANTLVTDRDNRGYTLSHQGPDTRRLSLNGGWERQFISTTGFHTTLSGLLRADSYWANNVVSRDATAVYGNALFTRVFEQGNAVVRYPLGRSGKGYQHLFEPIVAVTVAPEVRRIAKQPLEDSLDVEFDETNLFRPNRFTGSDLVEGGSRVTYGLRNAITADNGARIDIFGGQSYNFTVDPNFTDASGLGRRASDYVGRIDFSPARWLDFNYGFRLAQRDLSPQRQDAYLSAGVPVFRPFARYIQAYQNDTTSNYRGQVRQIQAGMSSQLTKYWALYGTHTQSFDPQPGPRSSAVALTYVDECFAFGVNVTHDATNRADISSGTSVAFHFYLKNLGGLHTDTATGIRFPEEFRQTPP